MINTELLGRALDVEAFISSCRIDGDHDLQWRRTAEPTSKPTESLYYGSAGIILFYLELHQATGDSQHLETAVRAGDTLLRYVASVEFLTVGIYSGWPGQIFVLNELAKASGQARFRGGAQQGLAALLSQATELGSGLGWIEPMPFSDITGMTGDRELLDFSIGAAGAGSLLLYAHRQALAPRALDWAIQVADRLLEMTVQTPAGRSWQMMADMPFPFNASNFAHGGAGVGFFLADLYRHTDNPAYLQAAIETARVTQSNTSPSGEGHLVCHTDDSPDLFYLGVCHGPAGTGRLMHLLHEITEDDEWAEWMHANMTGLLATGAPEVRTGGLWSNYSQCCGDAGIGDYAISLFRLTKDPRYLQLADRIAAFLLKSGVEPDDRDGPHDGGLAWAQNEHRARPSFLETQTGYMQGAAGIASFLLNLATVEQEATSKIMLPDSPFSA